MNLHSLTEWGRDSVVVIDSVDAVQHIEDYTYIALLDCWACRDIVKNLIKCLCLNHACSRLSHFRKKLKRAKAMRSNEILTQFMSIPRVMLLTLCDSECFTLLIIQHCCYLYVQRNETSFHSIKYLHIRHSCRLGVSALNL